MTVKEAYEKLTNKISGMQVTECYEYDSVFVFQLAPAAMKNTSRLLTGLTSVDKRTGAIKTFKPFDIPFEEYQDGKQVSISLIGG